MCKVILLTYKSVAYAIINCVFVTESTMHCYVQIRGMDLLPP